MGDMNSPGSAAGQARAFIAPSYQAQQQQQQRLRQRTQFNVANPFSMASVGSALASIPYPQSLQQQIPHAHFTPGSNLAMVYQMGTAAQFGVGGMQAMNQSHMHFQPYQPIYQSPQASLPPAQLHAQNQPYFQNPAFLAQQHSQQQQQQQQQQQPFYYPQAHYAQQGQVYQVGQQQYDRTPVSTSPNIPRGPPRKPKQSGNALWVGNLPTGASILDLKDHFARDATNDIESVFLISKSNCAFVNYKTEKSCAAAMARFHESRFQGTRLVCRLRRQTPAAAAPPGVPTGPAALTVTQSTLLSSPAAGSGTASDGSTSTRLGSDGTCRDKFFVVKSLTTEDLEMSVRNGIWATQSHNEEALNKAYATADNVYLLFSANKSGEYFGYARMASPINADPAAAIEFAPKAPAAASDDPEMPKAIPTPATQTAPKGHIMDDSARGTIFWEADVAESQESRKTPTNDPSTELDTDRDKDKEEKEDPTTAVFEAEIPKAWGKPFKLEWISTNRLPFYRTRGLRNPWNSNREVKIARDGTELETNVGKTLVGMFGRVGVGA